MNNILRFALVLFLVNLVAASILAGVYYVTKSKIEAQEKLVREEALKEVMPESVGDQLEPVEKNKEVKYWKVYKGSGDRVAGYIFIAKKYGYSSVIETMVGMKSDGTITGVRIISQNETPGLGAKIVEIVSDRTIFKAIKEMFTREKKLEKKLAPYFTEQFKGLDIKKINLSNPKIDTITGATISSRAVIDSIREKGLEILKVE
jgi:electron transport complex protein RnfG